MVCILFYKRRVGNQGGKNSRNPVPWERNSSGRSRVGNGHPQYMKGTKSRFIPGATDSRTKGWQLEGDSVCINREFSNNETLCCQWVGGQELPAGPWWGSPCRRGLLAEAPFGPAWRPAGPPVSLDLIRDRHLEHSFSGLSALQARWLWSKNMDLKGDYQWKDWFILEWGHCYMPQSSPSTSSFWTYKMEIHDPLIVVGKWRAWLPGSHSLKFFSFLPPFLKKLLIKFGSLQHLYSQSLSGPPRLFPPDERQC